jgi:hypothetical protein
VDADRIVRVRYFDGQFLRPQDFTDEQAYHVAMRRRHNIGGHTWGIVYGLELTAAEGLSVAPGLAVDGYGREIAVLRRLPVPELPPAPVTGEIAYDVWLVYDRVGSDQPPSGYAPCGPEGAAFYRWQELPRLLVTEADEAVDPLHPPGVPDGDLSFGPERTAPEEDHPWPVLLGRVRRGTNPGEFTVDGANRRYSGVFGASVVHPTGAARIDLGPTAPGDDAVFAVRSGDQAVLDVTTTDEGGVTTNTHGHLAVHGELRLDGALRFDAPTQPAPDDPGDPPEAWSLYGVHEGNARELRVAIDADSSFVVGAWSEEDSKFKPCLTVSYDGKVTVHGTLRVMGTLTAKDMEIQPPSTQARSLMTGAMLSGIAGAAGVAARLYRPQQGNLSNSLALVLALDPELRQQVAERLREEHGETAQDMVRQLGEPGE